MIEAEVASFAPVARGLRGRGPVPGILPGPTEGTGDAATEGRILGADPGAAFCAS